MVPSATPASFAISETLRGEESVAREDPLGGGEDALALVALPPLGCAE